MQRFQSSAPRVRIVEVVGPPNGRPFDVNWTGATWHVRTVSGWRTLAYRYGSGASGMIKRYADGPVLDCMLRPIRGLEEERGHAGDRDIADDMFNAAETLETAEVSTDRTMDADALR